MRKCELWLQVAGMGTYTGEQDMESAREVDKRTVDRLVRVRACNVDEGANEVSIPNVGHGGGSGSERTIHQGDVEEQLALGRRDTAAPHDGSLDRCDPITPVGVSEGLERKGREEHLMRGIRQCAHNICGWTVDSPALSRARPLQ